MWQPETVYDLELRPGGSVVIQFLNPDSSPFVIPGDTVLKGVVCDVFERKVADLIPTVTDASKGMIKLVLPDTTVVRSKAGNWLYYDLRLELPGGLLKYLPLAQLSIKYSPTSYQ